LEDKPTKLHGDQDRLQDEYTGCRIGKIGWRTKITGCMTGIGSRRSKMGAV